jgi:hypothetical protein
LYQNSGHFPMTPCFAGGFGGGAPAEKFGEGFLTEVSCAVGFTAGTWSMQSYHAILTLDAQSPD